MPLRDHFHSPLDDKHRWDSLHGGWPMKICESLFPQLTEEFVALPTVHLGGSVEIDLPDTDEYEVRIYDLKRGRKLVAAIVIVSPANKDRPESRRAFVNKCATLLQQDVSVSIVDLVTSHEFNLYSELNERLGTVDPTLTDPPANIYAVACRGYMPRKRWVFQAWHYPLTIGQPLPTLPIWLRDDLAISLDLETTYGQTCRVLRIA